MNLPSREGSTSDLVLRPSKYRRLVYFLIGLGFTGIGGLMIWNGDWGGWFVAGFFGVCTVVAAASILPGASSLRLSAEGFTVCNLFTRYSVKWAEIGPCFPGFIAGSKRVLFRFTDPARSPRLQAMGRALYGAEGALPDTYGMSADALANLMNEWRKSA